MIFTTGRVIFTVFAGRRRFMNVLMAYVQPLLQEGVVDEVHVWDYCKVAADREYLKGLSGTAGLRVMTPPPSDLAAKFPHKWKGYYAHYARSLRDDDLLVKCDDDVVFIANLHTLLAFARADGGAHHLYFPSIVNNDVSAVFQAADGVITEPEFTVGSAPLSAPASTPCSLHALCARSVSAPQSIGILYRWSCARRVTTARTRVRRCPTGITARHVLSASRAFEPQIQIQIQIQIQTQTQTQTQTRTRIRTWSLTRTQPSLVTRHVHSLFLARPARFFTGCAHTWAVPARVLFAMDTACIHAAYTSHTYTPHAHTAHTLTCCILGAGGRHRHAYIMQASCIHHAGVMHTSCMHAALEHNLHAHCMETP